MVDSKFRIQLEAQLDGHGKTFYVGKIKAPILIDCKDGVSFLVFTSSPDNEELQISSITKPVKSYEYKSYKVPQDK